MVLYGIYHMVYTCSSSVVERNEKRSSTGNQREVLVNRGDSSNSCTDP